LSIPFMMTSTVFRLGIVYLRLARAAARACRALALCSATVFSTPIIARCADTVLHG
jgi:hypothetical protein